MTTDGSSPTYQGLRFDSYWWFRLDSRCRVYSCGLQVCLNMSNSSLKNHPHAYVFYELAWLVYGCLLYLCVVHVKESRTPKIFVLRRRTVFLPEKSSSRRLPCQKTNQKIVPAFRAWLEKSYCPSLRLLWLSVRNNKYYDLDKLGSIMIRQRQPCGNVCGSIRAMPLAYKSPEIVDAVLSEKLHGFARAVLRASNHCQCGWIFKRRICREGVSTKIKPATSRLSSYISCPNVDHGNNGLLIGQVPELAFAVVASLAWCARLCQADFERGWYLKVSPAQSKMPDCDWFTMINTLVGNAMTWPIVPMVRWYVRMTSCLPSSLNLFILQPDLPIIGMGGVDSAEGYRNVHRWCPQPSVSERPTS